MKKMLLTASITLIFMVMSGYVPILSQEKPKPKKDTVNIDTDAKPVFYYAEEEENNRPGNGTGTSTAVIAGVVLIAGAAGFFLTRRKRK